MSANAMASRTTEPDGLGASQAETEKLCGVHRDAGRGGGVVYPVECQRTRPAEHAPGPTQRGAVHGGVTPAARRVGHRVAPAGSAMRQSATGPAAEPTVNGYTAIGLVRPDRSTLTTYSASSPPAVGSAGPAAAA